MKKILIVCWGNIYRSPVAKIFLDREIKKRGLESTILSRGDYGSFPFAVQCAGGFDSGQMGAFEKPG